MTITTDTTGRPYAKLSEVKPGDVLIADAGFTCIKEGALCRVHLTVVGREKFIRCADGEHMLDGQANDGGHLIGFYRPNSDTPGFCDGGQEIGVSVAECPRCGATEDDACRFAKAS